MAVIVDNYGRTFIVEGLPGSVSIRTHYATERSEKKTVQRQRMRSGAREVLSVLASSYGKRLTFNQVRSKIPHVGVDTLQVRLSLLTSRGDISRSGSRGSFTYSIPLASTFMSTRW